MGLADRLLRREWSQFFRRRRSWLFQLCDRSRRKKLVSLAPILLLPVSPVFRSGAECNGAAAGGAVRRRLRS